MEPLALLLKILRYVWAAPCTAVGLSLAIILLLLGGSMRVRGGVLEVALRRGTRQLHFPISAITFGHVVLGLNEQLLTQLRTHEFVHVRQYERWGLLFFLAYPASSLWQWFVGKNPYWDNHFEVEARRLSTVPRKNRRA
ncbi:hypothetical protein CJD38_01730 [Stenotrophobium rhamnosiphilum]|uniref:Signal peptide prediction n=1 Tax=Stenotrophobium rhamnosiphilum TaxID=2029166 RepID=A0A2T5MJW7_9GAMM|nr:hypothetical protein CJD38_01730 [Stenotrophobium rhamnosiphilum]